MFFRSCASIPGGAILNLRATGLDEQTCALLGKLLSVDRLFHQIDLADCALSDEGKVIVRVVVIELFSVN